MELKFAATSGSIKLNDSVFAVDFMPDLVHQVVMAYRNKSRQGSKAQKNRSDVRGGGAKPWRQKGTGRARAGTSSSPIWRSGGVAFAARPRDYSQKVNKKMYRGAVRAILSELCRQNCLHVVKDLSLTDHKTKSLLTKLSELKLENVLIIDVEVSKELYLASRNIPYVEVCDTHGVNPLSLVSYHNILITEPALKQLEERLA